MDYIELFSVLPDIFECIPLDKTATRIARLSLNIYAEHAESRSLVSTSSTAST